MSVLKSGAAEDGSGEREVAGTRGRLFLGSCVGELTDPVSWVLQSSVYLHSWLQRGPIPVKSGSSFPFCSSLYKFEAMTSGMEGIVKRSHALVFERL